MDLKPGATGPVRRPVVGMALFSDATHDSRVRREAATLGRAGYDVVLVCLGAVEGAEANVATDGARDLPPSVRVVVRVPMATTVLPGVVERHAAARAGRWARGVHRARWLVDYIRNLRAWGRQAVAAAGPVDAWHLHDLPTLVAIAPLVPRTMPVVYDSHEIFIDAGTARQLPGVVRTFLRAWERRLVSRAAAVVTVNESLAAVFARRYRPRRMVVVHNCPGRWTPPDEDPGLLRRAAGIPAGSPVILYHGSIGGGRGIEQLLDALLEPGLEAAHLVLMGPESAPAPYRAAAADPRWLGRAHVLDAVPPDELLRWVVSADVGGVVIQRTTLNHYLATPNKLFECLAAGVPVVTSDFPTMRRIVLEDPAGPLGTVCDPADASAIASAVRGILSLDPGGVADLRARCLAAAHERWNWESESSRLVNLYRELLPARP